MTLEQINRIASLDTSALSKQIDARNGLATGSRLDAAKIANIDVTPLKVAVQRRYNTNQQKLGTLLSEADTELSKLHGYQDKNTAAASKESAAAKIQSVRDLVAEIEDDVFVLREEDAEVYNHWQPKIEELRSALTEQEKNIEQWHEFVSQFDNQEQYDEWVKIQQYDLPSGEATINSMLKGNADRLAQLKAEKKSLESALRAYNHGNRSSMTADEAKTAKERVKQIQSEISLIELGETDGLPSERDVMGKVVLKNWDKLSLDDIAKYINLLGKHAVAFTDEEGNDVTWNALYNYRKKAEELDEFYNTNVKNSKYEAYDSGFKLGLKLHDIKQVLDYQKEQRSENELDLGLPQRMPKQQSFEGLTDAERKKQIGLDLSERDPGDVFYGKTNKISDEEYEWLKEYYDYKKQLLEFETGQPYFETYLDRKQYEWSKYAYDNPGSASIMSIADNFAGGISGMVGNTGSMIFGDDIDVNAKYNEATLRAQTMRAAVAQRISDSDYENWQKKHPYADYEEYSKIALTWGDIGSFAYMTGMSFADSMLAAGYGVATGGGSLISLGIMGTNAANSTVLQKIQQGYSDEEAFTLGIIAGAAEIVTEKMSLDALFAKGAKGFGYALKNFAVEGFEEGAAAVINFAADAIIMGDESEWSKTVQSYIDNGTDPSEAFWKAAGDFALQWGSEMLAGALCGGFAGGINAVFNRGNAASVGKGIVSKNLVSAVATLAENSNKKHIQRFSSLLNDKKLSNATIGNMAIDIFWDVETQLNNDIEAALTRRGYDKAKANELSSVISASIAGSKMSLSESRMAMSDAQAVKIAKEDVDTDRATQLNAIRRVLNIEQEIIEAVNGMLQDETVTGAQPTTGTDVAPSAPASVENGAPVNAAPVMGNVSGQPSAQSDEVSPAANVGDNVRPMTAIVDDTGEASTGTSVFDEPNLTDVSGVDTIDRVAQQMAGKSFTYTDQHRRVERVAEKLGRKLFWDCSFGDGYIDGNGNIHLAPDTERPISKVFKHELTHFLQKNEQRYNQFANAVMDSQIFKDWVKSKDYANAEAFAKRIIEVYEEAEQIRQQKHPEAPVIKIDGEGGAYQEMLADFVGERLFGGDSSVTEQLLNALENKPRRAFVDTVKAWFAKVKTALHGTKEGATIEQLEQEFIKAYKAAQKSYLSSHTKNTAQADGQYMVEKSNINTHITLDDVRAVQSIGRKSINQFGSEEIQKSEKWARKFWDELKEKSPFFRAWFGDWRAFEHFAFVSVVKMKQHEGKNPRGTYVNSDTGWSINSSSVGYDETISHSGKDKKSVIAMKNIDKIIENSILLDTEVSEYGRGKKSAYTAFMHKFYSPIRIDNRLYIAKMAVEESYAPGQNNTNKKFYHVRAINIETASSVGIGENHTPIIDETVSSISISDLFKIVKQYDPEFNPKPVSKHMLNDDGTPKVFYHGTNADFTAFDKKKSKPGFYGRGFYFTTEQNQANVYGKEMEEYLAIKNPLVPRETPITTEQIHKFLEAIAENEDYSIENYGTYDVDEILSKIESRDAFAVIQDINTTAIGDFGEAMQLFNEVNGTDFDGIVTPTETVVYKPNQIKSATGNIGTFDGANTDTQYSIPLDSENVESSERDSEGNTLSAGQAKYFKNSKLRDALGNLLRLFHGTQNGGFTKFLSKFSDDGISFFLTNTEELAKTYSGSSERIQLPEGKKGFARMFEKGTSKGNGQSGIYEFYANAQNPYVLECNGAIWNALPFYEKVKGKTNINADFTYDSKNNVITAKVTLDGKTYEKAFDFNETTDAQRRQAKKDLYAYYSTIANEELADTLTREGLRSTYGEHHTFAGMIDNKTGEISRLNTRFVSKWAKQNGYDGVVFKNVRDVGAFGFENDADDTTIKNDIVGDVVIVYDSSQIKSVDNLNPTKNKDIRYSIPFDEISDLLEQYEQGKLTREQYQAEVAQVLYNDKRRGTATLTEKPNETDNLSANTDSFENESLIEDPTTGPNPDATEISVAYMNGKIQPTSVQKAIKTIADKLGVQLEFAEFYNPVGSKVNNVNGYVTADGRMVANVFSNRTIEFILKHELTHMIKRSPGYETFKQSVFSSRVFIEWAKKKAGVSSGAEALAVLAQRAVEARKGITLKGVDETTLNESDIDGRDEVLGDFIGENCFGMDEASALKALRALSNSNRNIFKRLADAVGRLLDKLRGTQYDMSLRQIERRFRRVLNERPNGAQRETSEVQFSANHIKRPKGLASSRKTVYDEFTTNVMQWAYSSATQTGDRKVFINSKTRKYVLLEATEADGGFIELTTGTFDKVKEFLDEYTNTPTEEFNRYVKIARARQNNNSWDNDDANNIEQERANGEVSNRDSTERTTDRTRNTSKIGRYSEADSIDEPAFSIPKSDGKINLSVDSTVETDITADEIREQLKNGEMTVDEAMDAMQNLYGAIPQGELSSRDIDVPMQTSDGKYTRRFARTVLESEHLTDEQVSDVSEDLINEVLSYVPVGNEQAVKAADASIQNGTGEEEWKKVVYSGSDWASKEKIVIGERLLIQAAKDGDKARVCQLVAEIAEVGTRAGQVVQALSVLKRMNGAGQLMYVKRVVNRVNEDLKKRFGTDKTTGQPNKQLKINDTLAVQLVNAKGESEINTAVNELMKDLGEQMPSTFIDKWNAWRYLSMLGNLRTHVRNLAGNAVFIPAIKCKNALATAIEYMLPTEKRTKSFVVKKEYKDFAINDFSLIYDILTGNGKQNPGDAIRENTRVFKTKWLENLRKLNFNALELEDATFLKLHYASALGGYLQVQNVDLFNVDDATLQKARLYAIEEAQKATYRDASAVASLLSKLSKQNAATNALVEGVLPFKKTPVNILKRSVEYSPIGLMKAVSFNVYALKKGNITASQFVDAFASGLTGTGIAILGFFFSSLGMLRGPLGWGDKDDEFEELYGEQGYSIVIGDMSFTIDWMAPSCVPLFIGSELYNMLDAENVNMFDAATTALSSFIGPVFEMSMLDGINDTIKNVRFSDNPAAALIPETLSSYAGQAIPTISGQLARTVDNTRRTTYYDATSDVPKTVQKAWQRLANKLPGISYFSPEKVDAFGQTERKETASGWIESAAENFVLPGYIGHTEKDSVYYGLKDLEEKQIDKNSVLPSKIKDNYINVVVVDKNKKKSTQKRYLTDDEYHKYQTKYGTMSKQYLFDLIENPKYDSIDPAVKTKAVDLLYDYSKEVAKKAVFDEHVYSAKKYARWQQCEAAGISISELALVEALTRFEKEEQEDGAQKSEKNIYRDMVEEIVSDENEQELLIRIKSSENKKNADTIISNIISNYSGNN